MHAGDDVTGVRYLPQEPAEVPRAPGVEDPLRRQGPPRPPGVAAPDVHRPQGRPGRGPRQEIDQILHPMDQDVVGVEDPGGDGVRVHTSEDDLLLGLVTGNVPVLRCVLRLGRGHSIDIVTVMLGET